MLTIIPDYIEEGVEKWLIEFDNKTTIKMTDNERETNKQKLIEYGIRFNKLPSVEETIRTLEFKTSIGNSDALVSGDERMRTGGYNCSNCGLRSSVDIENGICQNCIELEDVKVSGGVE